MSQVSLRVVTRDDQAWVGPGFELVPFLEVDWPVAFKRGMAVVLENIGDGNTQAFLEDVRGGPNCPVAWAPDGRTLFATRQDEIVAIDAVDGSLTTIASASAIWTLAVTPEGEALLFQESDRQEPRNRPALRRVDIATGNVETVMPDVWSATFDWTDRTAYVVRNVPRVCAEVWRIGFTSSQQTKLATLESGGRISLSHDRHLLAVGDWLLPSRVRTVDVRTGEVRVFGPGTDPRWCGPVRRPHRRRACFGD